MRKMELTFLGSGDAFGSGVIDAGHEQRRAEEARFPARRQRQRARIRRFGRRRRCQQRERR